MFEKKIKCVCGKKVSKKENYCPSCGTPISEVVRIQKKMKEEEKAREEMMNSLVKDFSKSFGIPKIMQFPFEHLVKQLSKDVERQFREADQELMKNKLSTPKDAKKEDVKIMQDGKQIGDMQTFNFPGGFSVQVKIGNAPGGKPELVPQQKVREAAIPSYSSSKISDEEQEEISKLPREEAITKVRRFTNKIVYEIELPGVKDEKKIFINKLQNSIEIKAFAKDKAYFKLIPVSFPIKNWKFSKGKLILELIP